jgi:hypothetical protein
MLAAASNETMPANCLLLIRDDHIGHRSDTLTTAALAATHRCVIA